MATDPICARQVDERTAKNTSVFDGRDYYFCSAGCKKKFDADPASYVHKAAAVDSTMRTLKGKSWRVVIM